MEKPSAINEHIVQRMMAEPTWATWCAATMLRHGLTPPPPDDQEAAAAFTRNLYRQAVSDAFDLLPRTHAMCDALEAAPSEGEQIAVLVRAATEVLKDTITQMNAHSLTES